MLLYYSIMNESILNNSIVKSLTSNVKSITEKISDIITSNIPQTWMVNIILLMIACGVIFIGSKVTQKFAKVGLYILGFILIIGLGLNFISG